MIANFMDEFFPKFLSGDYCEMIGGIIDDGLYGCWSEGILNNCRDMKINPERGNIIIESLKQKLRSSPNQKLICFYLQPAIFILLLGHISKRLKEICVDYIACCCIIIEFIGKF